MLISVAYSISGIRSYNWRECMIGFVSLPHSATCNRDKSIMLQRNKSEA